LEGRQHPDRNAQFEHVHAQVKEFLAQGLPIISVDTKKKELVGNYSNRGQEGHPQGEPQKTLVHDFPDKELGKAIPYGIYDLGRNQGWVSVGIDHDTAEFAIDSILAWWKHMGRKVYPKATVAVVEGRVTPSGKPHRPAYSDIAFSARNQQVEQDRTPHVFLHHSKLAGKTADQLPNHHRFDCQHQDHDGAQDQGKVDTKNLSHRSRNLRRGNDQAQPETRRLPWRLELLCSAPMIRLSHRLFMREALSVIESLSHFTTLNTAPKTPESLFAS
jgi:hypothetical protein